MDINKVEIDTVLCFTHMHNHTPPRPVVVLSVLYLGDGEVRILNVSGTTGMAYPEELSEYSKDEYADLQAQGTILRLYSQRVTRLGEKMFRLKG